MKKILIILLFSLLSIDISFAKEYDFFDNGFKNYREAAKFMNENPSSDKRISWSQDCFYFGKKEFSFRDYMNYDLDGFKETVLTKSENSRVKLVFYESNGCRLTDTYFRVFFDNEEKYDSRTDFFVGRKHHKNKNVFLNLNFYIDKDYNNNGINELFIDAGYAFGMPWNESYYLFEYDEQSIKLVKKIWARTWKERLNLSDHFKKKFKVSEAELTDIIIENFNKRNLVSNILNSVIKY